MALSLEVCLPKKRQGRLVLAWRSALAKRKEKSGEILLDLAVGVFAALFAMRQQLFKYSGIIHGTVHNSVDVDGISNHFINRNIGFCKH